MPEENGDEGKMETFAAGEAEAAKAKVDEAGSWQWDIDRLNWCGVVEFSDGSYKFFKATHKTGLVFIKPAELIETLKKGVSLHQKGFRKLPKELKGIPVPTE